MKVLLTGADGYIGVRMGHYLLERGHEVVGLDTGFHRSGWLYNSEERRPEMLTQGHPRASPRTSSSASMPSCTWPTCRTTRWAS